MSATGSRTTRSEDEPGEKWDRCIADSLLKTGDLVFCRIDYTSMGMRFLLMHTSCPIMQVHHS